MKHEVELELKTIVTKDQFEKLVGFYQPLEFKTQHNYYYASNDPKHYGFRVRVTQDEQLFTLKNWENGQTYEYEKVFTGDFRDDPEIIEVLDSFHVPTPYTIFGELETERAVVFDGLAELCFDINHYNGIIDYELEYEVKKDHDYKTAFNQILAKANIDFIPSWGSKYKRCYKSLKK